MAMPLVSRTPSQSTAAGGTSSSSSSFRGRVGATDFPRRRRRLSLSGGGERNWNSRVRISAESSGEGLNATERSGGGGAGGGFAGGAMEVTTAFDRSFGEAEFPVWEKIGAVVRLSYGIGIYGAMGLAGRFICSFTGIDSMGGFDPSLDAILGGLGYSAPPIMALLFILDDEVVKVSPHARAIRDVEDEELRNFFYGMSPWQFVLIVAASSVGEELFYRAAAFAAAVTAALTGVLYFVASSPKDPTYVVAPVLPSRSGREDLKRLFAAWYERRQMRKIYSPLLEGLLSLYLGYEWIQTNNILAPMITHGIYSTVVLGHGLWKIHDHRRKLRHRILQLKSERGRIQ
ncbi:unnamed protein product [Linum tenue]|uniref:CAAX prenyl protease 2/Lysostaphin resistance protein A-like domain-containing protein n=1 Tax=Linum tenue TaxID=586396 RepID=A0AAV0PL80_9ROSI|nr:unnamed protein product [Linum tenue]